MKYYAYIPREDGSEPMGTANRCLFECKSDRYARGMAFRRLGEHYHFVLIRYTNLYDDFTHVVLMGKHLIDGEADTKRSN
jgi:hypothetical protein